MYAGACSSEDKKCAKHSKKLSGEIHSSIIYDLFREKRRKILKKQKSKRFHLFIYINCVYSKSFAIYSKNIQCVKKKTKNELCERKKMRNAQNKN